MGWYKNKDGVVELARRKPVKQLVAPPSLTLPVPVEEPTDEAPILDMGLLLPDSPQDLPNKPKKRGKKK